MTVWFDPFRVADAPCDADVVFVTHDHYDHFSPEDIHRVMKPDAVLVLPETCVAAALRADFASAQLLPVRPGEAYTVKDLPFTAVPAYNRRVCLRKAAQLLRDTSIQVHDICRQLGFVNRTNFYELFKREYGCTPAQYRRQNKL